MSKIMPLIAIAGAGLGIYFLYKHFNTKANFTTTRKNEYFNTGRSFDDIRVPIFNIPKPRNVHHAIGWTIPFVHDLPGVFPPSGNNRVSNDSYSNFDDTAREDGFAGLSRAYAGMMLPSTPMDSAVMPVSSTDPMVDAAIGDTDTVASIIVDPSSMHPHLINIENQILKIIISNTTSLNTILTNIDTIKQSISTYRHKLRLAYDQVAQRNITQVQFNQFLMQVVSDIATKLELPLKPQFTAILNRSPYIPSTPFI
jgi:hypothetical protein